MLINGSSGLRLKPMSHVLGARTGIETPAISAQILMLIRDLPWYDLATESPQVLS